MKTIKPTQIKPIQIDLVCGHNSQIDELGGLIEMVHAKLDLGTMVQSLPVGERAYDYTIVVRGEECSFIENYKSVQATIKDGNNIHTIEFIVHKNYTFKMMTISEYVTRELSGEEFGALYA